MRPVLPIPLAFVLLLSLSRAQEYTITDLGTLGGETSEANAINATGQVAGTADTGTLGVKRAFLWESGAIFNLGALENGDSSSGLAINDIGVVVGASGDTAARFVITSAPQQVGPDIAFPGLQSLEASGINAVGDICGTYKTFDFNLFATVFSAFTVKSGVYSILPTLGGTNSHARDINDSGIVVGTSQIAGNAASQAYQNIFGTHYTLGSLGGTDSRANAMNADGDIVGYSEVAGSAFYRAFIYRAGALPIMINLGTLARYSEAHALNSQEVAVGESYDANGVSRAVRFSGGQVADLNKLIKPGSGWFLTIAKGINDSGLIVGTGTNPAGKTRGFLLRPDLVRPTARFSKAGTVRTELPRFTVKGTAADNLIVKRIEYQVGRGPFKRAAGGAKWNFKVPLRPGKNRITVRAVDGAGNLSRISTLTLIRS